MQALINSGLCSLSDVLGTETSKGCITQIKALRSLWLIKPGKYFSETVVTLEEYKAEKERLILEGSLVVLNDLKTAVEDGNADAQETLEDDTMLTTNLGKYKFSVTTTNGLFFNRSLQPLSGFKKWNVILVTDDGVFGTKTTSGGMTGFTMGMFQATKLAIGSNTTTQKEGAMLQLLDRSELDSDYAFVADNTAKKQLGVTEVNISYVNVPTDGDVTTTIKATLAQDGSEAFTGVDFSAFTSTLDGNASNPTAGDDSATTGTYVLTNPAVTAEQVLIYKLDGIVTGADGDYYKSNTITATVTDV